MDPYTVCGIIWTVVNALKSTGPIIIAHRKLCLISAEAMETPITNGLAQALFILFSMFQL